MKKARLESIGKKQKRLTLAPIERHREITKKNHMEMINKKQNIWDP